MNAFGPYGIIIGGGLLVGLIGLVITAIDKRRRAH